MSTKPVTVSELKTFIDAVEFASDKDDWVPSERQWKRIREMINRLEEVSTPAPAVQYQQPAIPLPPQGSFSTPPGMPNVPSGFPPPMPSNPGNWGAPQPPLTGPFANGTANPVKTPDIDTGHGKQYQSSFA